MKTKCRILIDLSISIILINTFYIVLDSYQPLNNDLMDFSSGLATGILIAFIIKEAIKRNGFLSK